MPSVLRAFLAKIRFGYGLRYTNHEEIPFGICSIVTMLCYQKLSCSLYHDTLYRHTLFRCPWLKRHAFVMSAGRSLCLGIHLRHVCEKVQDSSRVAPLVIVPGNHLNEVVVQSNASLGVNNGGVVVAVQVGRDNVVVGD
jgi:hypothetical protein